MQNIRKNLSTIVIVLATIVLAGIAIFTAIKLYQTRQEGVTPNAPESKPHAAAENCLLTFTLATITPTPTGTASPTPTLTPTPTPVPQCSTSCTTNSDCISSMVCAGGVCRNPSCTTSSTCICSTPTPTPTSTPSPTPVPSGAPNACGGNCGSDSNCQSGMFCYITSGTSGVCRNPQCSTSTNCVCSTSPRTTVPTPVALVAGTPTPTPPSLPNSGTIEPTIIGIVGGAILLVAGLILVL